MVLLEEKEDMILIVLSHAHCIPNMDITVLGKIVMSVSNNNNREGEIIKNKITNEPNVTKISNKESVDLKDVTL